MLAVALFRNKNSYCRISLSFSQSPGRYSNLSNCPGHLRDKAVAVRGQLVASPSDMLIGSDQCEPSTVTIAQSDVRRGQCLNMHFLFRRGFNESSGFARVALCDEQSEFRPEMIVKRRAVGKPQVWRQSNQNRRAALSTPHGPS